MRRLQHSKFTRYFLFTRVRPRDGDYSLLIDTCGKINAFLGYRTVFDSAGVKRLLGFFVLKGPRAFVQNLCRLFPNFNLTPMASENPLAFFDYIDFDGLVIFFGEHPYRDVRKCLVNIY